MGFPKLVKWFRCIKSTFRSFQPMSCLVHGEVTPWRFHKTFTLVTLWIENICGLIFYVWTKFLPMRKYATFSISGYTQSQPMREDINVFSHWLRLCTARDRKKAHIYFLFQISDNWAFCTGQTCTKVSHSHYLLSCYKSCVIFSKSYCLTCEYDFHFGLLRQCQLVNVGRIQQLTQLGHCNTKPGG